MLLSKEDAQVVLGLLDQLMVEANDHYRVFEHLEVNEVRKVNIRRSFVLQEKLFSDDRVIRSYLRRRSEALTLEEKDLLRDWCGFLKAKFVMVEHRDEGTVFLLPQKKGIAAQYQVLGLTQEIAHILNAPLPMYVSTVLLPFKGQITYTGLMRHQFMRVGSEIALKYILAYRRALEYGPPITSLEIGHLKVSPGDGSFQERLDVIDPEVGPEVGEPVGNDPSSYLAYYRERGRLSSDDIDRRLQKVGANAMFVAVLDDVIVATAPGRKELDRRVAQALPEAKRNLVHIFKHEGDGRSAKK
ncbi:MAG: hypothetical protein WCK39_04365 [Methanomassiliicoccales archaeon]